MKRDEKMILAGLLFIVLSQVFLFTKNDDLFLACAVIGFGLYVAGRIARFKRRNKVLPHA